MTPASFVHAFTSILSGSHAGIKLCISVKPDHSNLLVFTAYRSSLRGSQSGSWTPGTSQTWKKLIRQSVQGRGRGHRHRHRHRQDSEWSRWCLDSATTTRNEQHSSSVPLSLDNEVVMTAPLNHPQPQPQSQQPSSPISSSTPLSSSSSSPYYTSTSPSPAYPGYDPSTFSLAAPLRSEIDAQRKGVKILAPASNQRRIESAILIRSPIQTVWSVLTDYDRLADYIPNLALSKTRFRPGGGVRLEQCGKQKILGFEFQASVVMDMDERTVEDMTDAQGELRARVKALDFHMVESRDFAMFKGTWKLVQSLASTNTLLFYEVEIQPKGLIPIKAIEWRIKEDLPGNLIAVKTRSENLARQASLSSSSPATQRAIIARDPNASSSLTALSSSPTSSPTSSINNSPVSERTSTWTPPTPFPIVRSNAITGEVSEIVISRPQPNRRMISAAITIDAPMLAVWKVLTDYDRLSEYIPNLAVSKRRYHPKGGIRLEQKGVQRILGFTFEANVVIDMKEVFELNSSSRSILFDLVESNDFAFFRGVWKLEEDAYGLKTNVTYCVEVQPKGLVPVRAVEWRIKEDLPANLIAVKNKSQSLTILDYMKSNSTSKFN